MNLIVFDCDDTLWELPYDENDYYMKLPESIERYEFDYKEEIIKIYQEKRKDTNNIIVLLSNRTNDVKEELINKLKEDRNIEFDYILLRDKERDKSKRLKKLIKSLKGVKRVEFYDDKERHLKSIKNLKFKFLTIKFKTFKV